MRRPRQRAAGRGRGRRQGRCRGRQRATPRAASVTAARSGASPRRPVPAHPPGGPGAAGGLRSPPRGGRGGRLREPGAPGPDPPAPAGQARRRLRHRTGLRRPARPGHLRCHPGPLRGPAAGPARPRDPRRPADRRAPAAGHARAGPRGPGPDRWPGPRRDRRRPVRPDQCGAPQGHRAHPGGLAGAAASAAIPTRPARLAPHGHPEWIVRALRQSLVAHGRSVDGDRGPAGRRQRRPGGQPRRPAGPGKPRRGLRRRRHAGRAGRGTPRSPAAATWAGSTPSGRAPPASRTPAPSWWPAPWPGGPGADAAPRRRARTLARPVRRPRRQGRAARRPGRQQGATLLANEPAPHRAKLVRQALAAVPRETWRCGPATAGTSAPRSPEPSTGSSWTSLQRPWRPAPPARVPLAPHAQGPRRTGPAAAGTARLGPGRGAPRRRGRLRHLLAAPGRNHGRRHRRPPETRDLDCWTPARRWMASASPGTSAPATSPRPSCGRTSTAPTPCSWP